jgi:3-deoxy-manno-octulosonate cytidylyltransferase (CMP-KDO synthetase)
MLAPVAGRPLIQWVVENTLRARRPHAVLVATDDERIARAVEPLGVQAVLTRPDHPSGTDRCAEAVERVVADVVVNVQGDEPLIDPDLIDGLAGALLADRGWDMATAASPIESEADLSAPSVVKVVRDAAGRALYFSRWPIPFVRDPGGESGGAGPLHWRHIGVYAYRREFLYRLVATPPCRLEMAEKLEQLRALHIGGRIRVLETRHTGIGVDTPEHVSYVEAALRERASRGKT